MGFRYFDRVRETTTTTGTGTITLAGAATGYLTFSARLAVGDSCAYCITAGSEWEVGEGTLTSTTTLTRDSVISSSNSDALVSFSAGTKDVFITMPAHAVIDHGAAFAQAAGNLTL